MAGQRIIIAEKLLDVTAGHGIINTIVNEYINEDV